ncbi:MAG: hypothetical protein ACU837_06485 [Gammaproteobacteria bacterium]
MLDKGAFTRWHLIFKTRPEVNRCSDAGLPLSARKPLKFAFESTFIALEYYPEFTGSTSNSQGKTFALNNGNLKSEFLRPFNNLRNDLAYENSPYGSLALRHCH